MSILRRLAVTVIAAALVVTPAVTAAAEPAWDSVPRIALVRADGSRFATVDAQIDTSADGLGDLFAGESLVPGAAITASFKILRLGGGASALTLGLPGQTELASPLAQELQIDVTTPTTAASGGFSALLADERVISLGVGEETSVPVTITVSLPASSTNATRERIVPFIIRATAADPVAAPISVPGSVPQPSASPSPEAGFLGGVTGALAATGITVRDVALGAGVLFVAGVLLTGWRRRRGESTR